MRPNGDLPPRMRGATAGTAGRRGLVPMPPAGSQTKFLRGDGTYQAIAGGGDMLAANNLGDVASAATSRANLGVYSQAEVAALRNALAPAQALSGDGTGKATFAVTLGSGDFSVALVASQPSTAVGYLLQRSSGTAPALYTGGDGKLYYNNGSTDVFYASFAELDTPVFITLVRSSGLTTMRFNGAVVAGPTADATNYSGVLGYIGGSASGTFFTGTLRLLGIENRALSAAEVLAVYQTGTFPASDFGQGVNDSGTTVYAGASMINGANSTFASDSGWWTMTGGTNIAAGVANFVASSTLSRAGILTIGKRYRAAFTLTASGGTFKVQDGATHFLTGLTTGSQSFEFVSGGTTFGISSVGATGTIDNLTITPLGLFVAPDWAGYTGGPQVIDVSGNGADTNLPGDGVTGGVVPTLHGATPSPFRYTRTSSGYLIADQLTIPPGCSVEIWAKGNGTFSLGDSSGTPASIVNAQTAPTNLSPIAQAGYVTATRKLYLTLGSATSVTVRVIFHAV